MIKANVKFFGHEQDGYGMPKPYHSYLVVASPWEQQGSGVASVIPLSSDTPALDPPHKMSLQGGPEKAFDEVLVLLRGLPQNKGLKELIHKD
ncbi:hypothetical protein FDP08_14115 [Marinobacter panjinensis]|uniref:Uncharacterized protein n=1 Tax=Marinobacter panjinensis TaxID=2576384 RepID=A0A4U6R5U3_9GAMM|nr:hypothetical protein [Marinobacter panjinensis]TKV69147.1 hypothetical protein FDP08_14115 [Marinobacter panjinensis]